MRKVAVVVTAINLAAITAATLILYKQHSHDAVIEQVRREHQELVLQIDRIERLVAAAPKRYSASARDEPPASTSALQSCAADIASTAARPHTPEEQAAHDELVRTGNALADRTIASGVSTLADLDKLTVATRGLSSEERVRIMARLSAAINANQLRLELSSGSP